MANEKKVSMQLTRLPQSEPGNFANLVTLTLDDEMAILDFAVMVPQTDPQQAKIFQRIYVSHKTAQSLSRIIDANFKKIEEMRKAELKKQIPNEDPGETVVLDHVDGPHARGDNNDNLQNN